MDKPATSKLKELWGSLFSSAPVGGESVCFFKGFFRDMS